MFYRLPFLFSASYYLLLLLAQIIVLLLDPKFTYNNRQNFYLMSRMALNDVTSFFLVFILSCLFFYKNKLYFYIPKNKYRVIILGGIFAAIYFVVEYLLHQLTAKLLLQNLINLTLMNNYSDRNYYYMIPPILDIIANIWTYLGAAIILYCFVKLSRRFFKTPLIDSVTRSSSRQLIDSTNQLSSYQSVQDYRKLYAIIFASTFCCVANGAVWNVYFNLLFAIDEINIMLIDYYDTIFCFMLVSLIINYLFLYKISQKFIVKTYHWLPISSLLTASAITLILFGLCAFIISCIVLPFVFKSIVFLFAWFAICYIILYYLTRFVLRHYFA